MVDNAYYISNNEVMDVCALIEPPDSYRSYAIYNG